MIGRRLDITAKFSCHSGERSRNGNVARRGRKMAGARDGATSNRRLSHVLNGLATAVEASRLF